MNRISLVLFAALLGTAACGDSSSNPLAPKSSPPSSPTAPAPADPGTTGGSTGGTDTGSTGGSETGTAGSDTTSTSGTDSGSTVGGTPGSSDITQTGGTSGGTSDGSESGTAGSDTTSTGGNDSGSTAGTDSTSTGSTDSGSTDGGGTDAPATGEPVTEVPIGEYVLSVSVGTSGNTSDGIANANKAKFTLGFVLAKGSAVIGCETAVQASVVVPEGTTIHQNNCDPETGARNLVINNPTKGVAAEYEVRFSVEGSDAVFRFKAVVKD